MRLESIPIGTNPPFDVNVIVEVPIGGEPIKYELDKASGAMFVDRMLYTSMHYPGDTASFRTRFRTTAIRSMC